MNTKAPRKSAAPSGQASRRTKAVPADRLCKKYEEAIAQSEALDRRLRTIAELSMTRSNDPVGVFNKIAGMIASLLEVPVVCLSRIDGDTLHFLSVYKRGKLYSDCGAVPVQGTPCATVQKSKRVRVYHDVGLRFPLAGFLNKYGAYSYCGFPALDSRGMVVAVTCLIDNRPHQFSKEDLDLLQVFGHRIGIEIERQQQARDQRRMEEALLGSEEKYRALVESTDDSIYLVDTRHRYLFMNQKHLQRLGLHGTDYIGHAYGDYHSAQETKEFKRRVTRVLLTGKSLQYEHVSHRDRGYFLRTLSPVRARGGAIVAVTIVSKHITKRKHLEERLRALSITDELTGLYNCRGFITLAGQQLKLANRLRRGMLLLTADLDGLKTINDTLGHREGDAALIETATVLRRTFRDADIIARIGGDEFVVMLVENSAADTALLFDRLEENIRIQNARKRRRYTLSISYGIAHCRPECPLTLDQLLAESDRLMYDNKIQRRKS